MGLEGGIVCKLPPPSPGPGPGALASPVFPDFFKDPLPENFFVPLIEDLMRAFDTGEDSRCSRRDYRQVLEIAIARKQSVARNH